MSEFDWLKKIKISPEDIEYLLSHTDEFVRKASQEGLSEKGLGWETDINWKLLERDILNFP